MADHTNRILASYTDVVAVEHTAPGMVRVVTHSDSYTVDARHEACECPDYEYNLDGQGRCKHLWAALRETDQLNTPTVLGLDDDLEQRPEPVACDGGQRPDDCNCPPNPSSGIELPCFQCYLAGHDTVNTEKEA